MSAKSFNQKKKIKKKKNRLEIILITSICHTTFVVFTKSKVNITLLTLLTLQAPTKKERMENCISADAGIDSFALSGY